MVKNPVSYEVDTRELEQALKAYLAETNKSEAQVLARAARNAAFKAEKGPTIRADDGGDLRRYKPKKKGEWSKVPYAGPGVPTARLLYAITSRKGERGFQPRKKGDPIRSNADAMKIWKRRFDSRGYLKAFWITVANQIIKKTAYVGTYEGNLAVKQQGKFRSSASLEAAAAKWIETNMDLTTPHKKYIDMDVTVQKTAENRMAASRNLGISKTAREMAQYAEEKFRKSALRHSA